MRPLSVCIRPRDLPAMFLLAVLAIAGCGDPENSNSGDRTSSTEPESQPDDASEKESVLRLASTTSTRDSGLLDVLLPEFEKLHGCRVDLIARGTGAALKLGENGDVDVVLCHAKQAEETFMDAGHGVRREAVMHNSFVIVGPVDDPADIIGFDVKEAFKKIAEGKHLFVSRDDNSGTHIREESLWKTVDIAPNWNNYLKSGQGMGATLTIASNKQAYALVDQGTWFKRRRDIDIDLVQLVGGDEALINPYSVIAVDPEKHKAINAELAEAFVDFLISEPTQKLIRNYKVGNRQLFIPDRIDQRLAE